MKVLFLDIDGVLNSDRSFLAHKLDPLLQWEGRSHHQLDNCIDPVAVGLLNLVLRHDVKVVVSSTHRKFFPQLPALKEYIRELGVQGEVIGATPDLWKTPNIDAGEATRGHEIDAWLSGHGAGFTHFAIVDDDSDMLAHQLPFFVHVNGRVGLDRDNLGRLQELLALPEPLWA
jgi:hypothetical protein